MEKEKSKSRFAGKGFLLLVAICLIAVGAAVYSTVSNTVTEDKFPTVSLNDTDSAYNSSEKMTTKQESDIPDNRKAEESKQTKEKEEKEKEDAVADCFVMPVDGNIPKGFSANELQYSATYGDSRLHTGIDIVAELGSKVKSAGKGKIISVEKSGVWGNTVQIDHGNGIVVSYSSVENIKVKTGDIVKAGQELGTLGEIPCECSDAPHLHLSCKQNGETVSPLKLVGVKD